MLRPFWRYYGGKWRAAPRYPKPKHGTIIEPFAGAAGYSLRYPDRNVILVEKYPVIAEIWRYLIRVSPSEILAIPEVDHVDDLPGWVPQAARWLVGFCMSEAVTSPRPSKSKRVRRGGPGMGWAAMRARAAIQVEQIRHWRVIDGDFSDAPDITATWFIDPPYESAGKYYQCPSRDLDFTALGAWCRSRTGLVIVCENYGAKWLPFRPFYTVNTKLTGKVSTEAIWTPRILDQVGL